MDNISINIVEVTPAMAKALLDANPRNRNRSPKRVKDLVRAILAGEWALNGEAIKISYNGELLDGQHRLAAIVESGMTVRTVVITGLPPHTQDTMDTGAKRTTADVLAIHGEGNTNVLASVAKRVWMWERGNHKFGNFSLPSAIEIIDTIDQYPSVRRSAEIGVRTNQSYRAAGASVTGTAHHILHKTDESDAAEFFAQLATGARLELGHPILTLRSRLQSDRDASKRVPFHVGVALYIRSWNAIREGRELSKLQQPPEANMPMPV